MYTLTDAAFSQLISAYAILTSTDEELQEQFGKTYDYPILWDSFRVGHLRTALAVILPYIKEIEEQS